MTGKCAETYCYAPESSCKLGEATPENCARWSKLVSAEGAPAQLPSSEALVLPWTGNSFGGADRAFAAARSSGKVVAIVGPASAGKTTLLAAWYLLVGRGSELPGRTFSGSYTLAGWENIAHALRWASAGGPSFPPHTSSGSGRHPGLLHMAFRSASSGTATDLLFVDAPGEWFRLWAVNRDGPEAAGARWVAEHADVFVVVADSEALSGPDRGVARSVLIQILQRLGHERRGRGVALVWAKSDVVVSAGVRATVEDAAKQHLGQYAVFSTSVQSGALGGEGAFMNLLRWCVDSRREPYSRALPTLDTQDYFLVVGHGR